MEVDRCGFMLAALVAGTMLAQRSAVAQAPAEFATIDRGNAEKLLPQYKA